MKDDTKLAVKGEGEIAKKYSLISEHLLPFQGYHIISSFCHSIPNCLWLVIWIYSSVEYLR